MDNKKQGTRISFKAGTLTVGGLTTTTTQLSKPSKENSETKAMSGTIHFGRAEHHGMFPMPTIRERIVYELVLAYNVDLEDAERRVCSGRSPYSGDAHPIADWERRTVRRLYDQYTKDLADGVNYFGIDMKTMQQAKTQVARLKSHDVMAALLQSMKDGRMPSTIWNREGKRPHDGDPCSHCGRPHDLVRVGPCPGRLDEDA